jgi:hypothetical protein
MRPLAEPPRRYERRTAHDKRLRRGDDYAGDAWFDTVEKRIKYVAVGTDPNRREMPVFPYRN